MLRTNISKEAAEGGWLKWHILFLTLKKKQYLMVMAWIWMNIHVMRDDVDGIRKRLNPLQVSGSPLCGGGQL